MLRHILVAIDKSVASHQAFNTALELAQALEAKLTLVHVLDIFDPASPQRPHPSANSYSLDLDKLLRENYERQWAEFVQHYDALLKQQQQQAKAMGIACDSQQPYGPPGSTLCRVARDCQADVILVGSHARRGLSEMLLGSVSNYITHHAPCSVMVIHPESSRNAGSTRESAAMMAAGSVI
ncbi:MAG: universal stress protein [Leptolyngbya sp. SIOISBB]|nr:universal stress protein [Leptolyngbya sp. SIOISBB]